MKKNVKKRTSIIWTISDEEFAALIQNSKTLSQVLKHFGMGGSNAMYGTCWARIRELGLDTSHFCSRVESCRFHISLTEDEVRAKLVENSSEFRANIKRLIIKFNIIPYRCANCDNGGHWMDKKLCLQLEHINGVSNDNRIENLQFLCPNCHSQTDTYAGKRHRRYHFCKTCNLPYGGNGKSGECHKCSTVTVAKNNTIAIPNRDTLEALILKKSLYEICEIFSVSIFTVKKWYKSYDIDYEKVCPFSRSNTTVSHAGKTPTSQYKYVAYLSAMSHPKCRRNKWLAHIKDKSGRSSIYKICDTEMEAANAIAEFLGLSEPMLR